MQIRQTILNHFPSFLFWDVDPALLDLQEDIDFIIPRALLATTAVTFDDDISRLEKVYTRMQIIDSLKHTKERISNNVCNLVAKHYHIQPFLRFQL